LRIVDFFCCVWGGLVILFVFVFLQVVLERLVLCR
jgi:hypothetical protein